MSAWSTWAGDAACVPAARERPADTRAVVAALERAAGAGHTVRVAGAGHSFGDLVPTDGALLSLERMDRVLGVDTLSSLVRVQAGITLRALSRALDRHGLALENLGDIDVQTLAGATATGTHGTGARLRNLSSALHAVRLVTADGRTLELTEHDDPDGWRAARVGLGALGVVTEATLRTVPAFTLEGVDAPAPLEETLDALEQRWAAHEHFELFTFPHSPLALTRTNTRVPGPPRPRGAARAWVEDVLVRNHVFGLCCRAGRARPALIGPVNRALSRASGTSRRVDRSYEIFASPRRVRFVEMEYAVPRTRAADAVRAVRELIDARGHDVSFPLELRAVAGDDALLSPAHGRDTAYLAVHVYEGMAYEPFFSDVERAMDALDGRPHWGKRHFQTAATLRRRYPEWERFAAVRARLDPDGRFANPHVRRVLGA